MYDYKFYKWVEKELLKLDWKLQKLFLKALNKIRKNPKIWKNLWNKAWNNLTWLKKIYFSWKKMRMVYKIEDDKLVILIVSVWKREKMEVYKKAGLRI